MFSVLLQTWSQNKSLWYVFFFLVTDHLQEHSVLCSRSVSLLPLLQLLFNIWETGSFGQKWSRNLNGVMCQHRLMWILLMFVLFAQWLSGTIPKMTQDWRVLYLVLLQLVCVCSNWLFLRSGILMLTRLLFFFYYKLTVDTFYHNDLAGFLSSSRYVTLLIRSFQHCNCSTRTSLLLLHFAVTQWEHKTSIKFMQNKSNVLLLREPQMCQG